MNKSHITDEQVRAAREQIGRVSGTFLSNKQILDVLEDAFPEQQPAGLSDERFARCVQIYKERTQVNGDLDLCAFRRAIDAASVNTQQPAAFGPLVVSYEMAEQVMRDIDSYPAHDCVSDLQQSLQSFVDRHSIKPIAFADRMPEEEEGILYWDSIDKDWFNWKFEEITLHDTDTHWLPASSLPIPEPAVDADEIAWREFLVTFPGADSKQEVAFKRGYHARNESAQQNKGK